MNDNQSARPSNNTAIILARWIAVMVAGACTIVIVMNLAGSMTTDGCGRRIVSPLGLILISGGVLTRHDRVRLVLGIAAALTVVAAVVLDVSGF